MSDSLQPHGLARQAPLSVGILQARILEWVAYPFSRGSSQPRDQNGVSCIAGDQASNRFLPAELPGKPINSLGMQNGDI